MIRFAIVLLLLANALYYTYSHGMLSPLGWEPENPAEPERLHQQIKPQALRIMTPQEAAHAQSLAHSAAQQNEYDDTGLAQTPADAPEPEPRTENPAVLPEALAQKPEKKECLQASGFDVKQLEALRLQLVQLPEGSWKLEPSTSTGRWMVYIGKFSNQEALDKRRSELRNMDISTDRARTTALEPGISLGRFASEEAAAIHLAQMVKKGVSGAKVVLERPEATNYTLRLLKADSSTKKRVDDWAIMAGKELRPCP